MSQPKEKPLPGMSGAAWGHPRRLGLGVLAPAAYITGVEWDYVTRGMWNSFVSKTRGLRGGLGSLLALCSSLKSPVPMFMGIPMMMHSDTPATTRMG